MSQRPSRAVAGRSAVIESGSSDDGSDASDVDAGTSSAARKRKSKVISSSSKRQRRSESRSSGSEGEVSDVGEHKNQLDGYGEDLTLDEEDRQRLGQMTEMEREQEIFKRLEQRDMLRHRMEIQQKLAKKSQKMAKRNDTDDEDDSDGHQRRKKSKSTKTVSHSDEGSPSSRRSASPVANDAAERRDESAPKRDESKTAQSDDEEYDVDYHRPSEQLNKLKKKSAMADLLVKRKEKRDAEQKKIELKKSALEVDDVFGNNSDDDDGRSSSSSSSRSSSASSRSSSRSRSASPKSRRPIETKEDLSRIRLSRYKLSQFCHTPFFKNSITGCFVRVGIGSHQGRSVYRVGQITDVVETAKVYQLENTSTNLGLKLKHGTDERVYRMAFVSNSEFTDTEYSKWIESMRDGELPLVSIDTVEKKENDIKAMLSRTLTEADVEHIVKLKKKFKKNIVNFAMKKEELSKKKDDAEADGNVEEVRRLQDEIDSIDNRAEELNRERMKGISAISWINQRNREHMKNSFLGDKPHEESVVQDDPFTRKSGKMRMVSGTSKVAKVEKQTLSEAPTSESTALPLLAKPSSTSAIANKVKDEVDDLFNEYNFDIDIDIDIPVNKTSITDAKPSTSASSSSNRPSNSRAISLDDYKRRRGLI